MNTLDIQTTISAARIGGPGAPDVRLCSEVAIAALSEIAGDGLRMTSLSIDVTSHALGPGEVELHARTDKRTKSIVFASVEARAGGRVVFSAQGLFSRVA